MMPKTDKASQALAKAATDYLQGEVKKSLAKQGFSALIVFLLTLCAQTALYCMDGTNNCNTVECMQQTYQCKQETCFYNTSYPRKGATCDSRGCTEGSHCCGMAS